MWLTIWTFGLVLATIGLSVVAWKQLSSFNDTAKEDSKFAKAKFVRNFVNNFLDRRPEI